MTATANLGLPFIEASQAQKHVTHNEALRVLDALVMLSVIDRDLSAPPASPAEGDRYLVKATGGGSFSGKDNQIAHFSDGAWTFYPPRLGWTCYVIDEGALLCWSGTAWEAALDVLGGVSELQNMSLLGIGTAADTTNPFSAKLNNTLWTALYDAEGGDGNFRYKLNKETAADTLSMLFQTAYSGRAEIGLTGDDDLHVKVSGDGSSWIDALLFDKATGSAKINSGLFLTGDISPSQITADQNDYNPAGLSTASVLRLSSDAPRNLTGLSGGGDGRIVAVVNTGLNAIVLKDASVSSAAGNRFAFGADVTLAAKQSAVLWYDAADGRWKLLAGPQAASGGSGGGGPVDLDILLAEMALGLADALNAAQFLGASGNRFADALDATTYVDNAGSINIDIATSGLIKPTSASGGNQIAAHSGSYSSASGTISASGEFGSPYFAYAACDGNTADDNHCWLPGAPTGWLKYAFAAPKTIASYAITSLATREARAPKNFALEGSNTGAFTGEQTALGTQTNVTNWTGTQTKTFTLSTPQSFSYYRLNVTANNGDASHLQIAEIALNASGFVNNMTAKSAALVAATAPVSAKCVARAKFVDPVVLGVDLIFDLSRDGGGTWSTFVMNDRFTTDAMHILESDTLDISGQPSGTSIKWQIRTANNKMVEIHGVYLHWS